MVEGSMWRRLEDMVVVYMDSGEPSHQIVDDDDDQCWKRKEMDP